MHVITFNRVEVKYYQTWSSCLTAIMPSFAQEESSLAAIGAARPNGRAGAGVKLGRMLSDMLDWVFVLAKAEAYGWTALELW